MRFALTLFVLLLLCPMEAGLGQQVVRFEASLPGGMPVQGTEENSRQTSPPQKGEDKPLNNADVVSMVKAGLAESTVILAIQHSSTAFDTSPQELISLQGQGVPQKVLDAMLNAGNEKAASPAGQASAEPATIGGSGKWDVREEVPPDGGSPTVTLILRGEQELPGSSGLGKRPQLFIRCQSRQTDVYLRTGSLPADNDANGGYKVRVRLDNRQPSNQLWDQSTGHDSLFAPEPIAFARTLAAAKTLALEFTPSGSGPVTARFDLQGVGGGLGKVADACGWSVQGDSAAAGKTEDRPPELHAIRKVVIDADWSDDDEMLARKSLAIARHTCLQVVDTLAAADAVLKWSIQGFTGGALELRSKDGQVLWSKAGSFSTPLTALKQAVGCPK